MKKVTAVLALYAIIVIASCICWVWYALSKSSLTAGNSRGDINVSTDDYRTKKDANGVTDKATELTGGVTEGRQADGQANDIVKSNDL